MPKNEDNRTILKQLKVFFKEKKIAFSYSIIISIFAVNKQKQNELFFVQF